MNDGLLKINDVNPIPLGKDVGFHLGIPAAGAVPKVDSCFKQGLHRNNMGSARHIKFLRFFVRPRQPARDLNQGTTLSVGERVY